MNDKNTIKEIKKMILVEKLIEIDKDRLKKTCFLEEDSPRCIWVKTLSEDNDIAKATMIYKFHYALTKNSKVPFALSLWTTSKGNTTHQFYLMSTKEGALLHAAAFWKNETHEVVKEDLKTEEAMKKHNFLLSNNWEACTPFGSTKVLYDHPTYLTYLHKWRSQEEAWYTTSVCTKTKEDLIKMEEIENDIKLKEAGWKIIGDYETLQETKYTHSFLGPCFSFSAKEALEVYQDMVDLNLSSNKEGLFSNLFLISSTDTSLDWSLEDENKAFTKEAIYKSSKYGYFFEIQPASSISLTAYGQKVYKYGAESEAFVLRVWAPQSKKDIGLSIPIETLHDSLFVALTAAQQKSSSEECRARFEKNIFEKLNEEEIEYLKTYFNNHTPVVDPTT